MARYHEFRGEMRILRDAREAREFARRDELLEVLPEGLPALREGVLGGSAEEIVRKVARAEGREEGEAFLFFRGSVPRLLLDLGASIGWRRCCPLRASSSRGRGGERR